MFLATASLDQTKYNFSLEVCALIFLIIFAIKFFSKRKFPNVINVVFAFDIICALLDVSLDIVASVMVNDINNYPVLATEIVNGLFYCFQALFPALCALYVFTLSENASKGKKWHILVFLPAAIFFVIQLFNPLHHWLFKIEGEPGNLKFVHTDVFIVYYIMCMIYVLLSVVYTGIYRKHFDLKQRISIYTLVGSIVLAIIIQYFVPHILLTGTAITIAVYIALETFADPNHMIDRVSGAFNLSALLYYFKTKSRKVKAKYFLYIKIDKMANINQTFSVGVANDLYRQIGTFFKSFNKKAWVFRIYNSRFLLLLDSEVDAQRAAYFSEIRFRSPWEVNNHTFNLDAQILKYTSQDNSIPIDNLLETFSMAFEDQKMGTGSYIIDLDSQIVDKAMRKRQVSRAVEEALKTGKGFSMRYQPIYNVNENTFDYCEGLLRLEDPILGKISPDEFIPIAEAAGFAPEIDRWVLNQVCAFTKEVPEIKQFSINISGAEFFENPAKTFISICKMNDVHPSKVIFEVTETSAVTHIDKIQSFITDLRNEGFSLAIDDFGTGYSNLSQLNKLEIKKAKFDRSLLEDTKLLKALFEMMKKIEVSVVMEGVETKEQFDLVKSKVDYIQGYYFSMPLTETEFIKFIKDKGIRK